MKNAPINDPEAQDQLREKLNTWLKSKGRLRPVEDVDGYPVPGRTGEELRIIAMENMAKQRIKDAEDGIVYEEEDTVIQDIDETDTPVSHESEA